MKWNSNFALQFFFFQAKTIIRLNIWKQLKTQITVEEQSTPPSSRFNGEFFCNDTTKSLRRDIRQAVKRAADAFSVGNTLLFRNDIATTV